MSAPPSPALLAEHRRALLAQCPAPPPTPADATSLPIATTDWGAVGSRVLLIHGGVQGGLGGGPATWDGQEALAKNGWRIVRVDRPGFGRSPSRGVDDMMRDAVWIADMLGDGAFLVGHLWGGAESLLAAARRPQAVRALVLVEPALASLSIGAPELLRDPEALADALKMPGSLISSKTPADYGRQFAENLGAMSNTSANAASEAMTDSKSAESLGCSLLQAKMATPDEMRAATQTLKGHRVPVLVISGGWSPAMDVNGEIIARLTDGQHVIVHSPNHFVQQMNAIVFNETIDAFMRSVASRIR